MAQLTIKRLIDDIDGSEALRTVHFGIDGSNYEIDLSGKHCAELVTTLRPYMMKARRPRVTAIPATFHQRGDTGYPVLRKWLLLKGYAAPGRGTALPEYMADVFKQEADTGTAARILEGDPSPDIRSLAQEVLMRERLNHERRREC